MALPITITKKSTYALKALLELGLRGSPLPMNSHDIAAARDLPHRFLEIILADLRNTGFIVATRGSSGGYALARLPSAITVGQIFRAVNGADKHLLHGVPQARGDSVSAVLIARLAEAVRDILDSTTLADLIDEEEARRRTYIPNYAI